MAPTPLPVADAEFDLDISFVASGLTAAGFESEDCTSDNCGGTDESACTTC
jgi:FxLD family lantipeptide